LVNTDPKVKTYGINDLMLPEEISGDEIEPKTEVISTADTDQFGIGYTPSSYNDGNLHKTVKTFDPTTWADSGEDEANATDDSRFTLTVISRIEDPIVIWDLTHYEATKKLQLLMNSEVQSVLIVKDSK
jgi:hypothetical protein